MANTFSIHAVAHEQQHEFLRVTIGINGTQYPLIIMSRVAYEIFRYVVGSGAIEARGAGITVTLDERGI